MNENNNLNNQTNNNFSTEQPPINQTPSVYTVGEGVNNKIQENTNYNNNTNQIEMLSDTVTIAPIQSDQGNTNTQTEVTSTPQIYPTVSAVTSTNQPNPPEQPGNNIVLPKENNEEEKPNKGKTAFLIILFIFLGAFVIFLPEISNYLQHRNTPKTTPEIENGILTCKMEKTDDQTITSYQMDFRFSKKELITATYKIQTESEDKKIIEAKNTECQNISNAATNTNGIEVDCTTNANIATIKQNYTLQLIDNNNLTKFTEAGGTYPEYKFQENIYDIKTKMIDSGYDCEVKAS